MQKLLGENPDKAKTLNQDGLDELSKQEQYNSMRMAISTYSPALNGVDGFNTGTSRSTIPVPQTASSNVLEAYRAVPSILAGDKTADADQPSNVKPTNTLWVQRAGRNVVFQTAKALVATDPSNLPEALQKFSLHDTLSDKAKALLLTKNDKGVYTGFNSAIDRANNGLSSYLFLNNGAFCLDTYHGEAHTFTNMLEDGAYGVQHDVFGTSRAMAAVLPQSKMLDLVKRWASSGTLRVNSRSTLSRSAITRRRPVHSLPLTSSIRKCRRRIWSAG